MIIHGTDSFNYAGLRVLCSTTEPCFFWSSKQLWIKSFCQSILLIDRHNFANYRVLVKLKHILFDNKRVFEYQSPERLYQFHTLALQLLQPVSFTSQTLSLTSGLKDMLIKV